MVTKRVGRIQAFKHHHIVPSFFYFLSLSFFAVIRWLECVHCLMCKAQFLIRLTVQQRKKFAVRAPRQRSRSCKKKRCKVWINHFTSLCRVRNAEASENQQRECAAEIWDNFSSARQVHCGRSTSVDRLRFFSLEHSSYKLFVFFPCQRTQHIADDLYFWKFSIMRWYASRADPIQSHSKMWRWRRCERDKKNAFWEREKHSAHVKAA